jgi:hypothetical protein
LKEDYLVDSIRKLHTCIVRFATIDTSTVDQRDQQQEESAAADQFDLDIPCPKAKLYGGHCSNDDCLWECDDCAHLIIFEKPKDVSEKTWGFFLHLILVFLESNLA